MRIHSQSLKKRTSTLRPHSPIEDQRPSDHTRGALTALSLRSNRERELEREGKKTDNPTLVDQFFKLARG
ncbi:hypothetical protein K1719_008886 [Acacia pycnantha]|nr:hypothetical protein K1719_008886 [Acacia pycnantha]